MVNVQLRQLECSIPAGSTEYIGASGAYLRLKYAPGGVALRVQVQELGIDVTLDEGDELRVDEPFSGLRLSHSSGSELEYVIQVGRGAAIGSAQVGGSISVSGAISLSGAQGAYTQAVATVTNASGLLIAANSARRVLGVSNQSGTGTVYLNLSGDAATSASGLRLLPGESLWVDSYPPTEAVYAIGDIASNANVIVIEG